MKKVLLFICILFSLQGVSQIILTRPSGMQFQQWGSASTWSQFNGVSYGVGGFVNGRYADTASANATWVSQIPGSQIIVDNGLLIRNSTATGWISIPGSGGGSDFGNLFWETNGNTFDVPLFQAPYIGINDTTSGYDFVIRTRGQQRLSIPNEGIVRSSGGALKSLMYDTANQKLYYGDGGSGSVDVNNGLVKNSSGGVGLDSAGVNPLTREVLIDADGNDFFISNGKDILINSASGDNYLTFNDGTYEIENGIDFSSKSIVLKTDFQTGGALSEIIISATGIHANPNEGNFNIDTLNSTTDTTGKSLVIRNLTTGLLENIDPALIAPTPTLQQVLTAGSTLTTGNTIDAGAELFEINNADEIILQTSGNSIQLLSNSNFLLQTTTGVIQIKPALGNVNIDTLNSQSNATDSMVVWDAATGDVGIRSIPTGGGITVGDAISSGTANRILYEDSSNELAESSNLTFDGSTFTSVVGGTFGNTLTFNSATAANRRVDFRGGSPGTYYITDNSANSRLDIISGGGVNISASTGALTLVQAGSVTFFMGNSGLIGIGGGIFSPSARLQIAAQTTGASTAPIKLTSGSVMTTAEAGAIEYNGTNLFFTPSSATRNNILMTASVNTVSPTSPDRTITVVINGTTYYIAAKTSND